MKKLLLLFSCVFPLLFNNNSIVKSKGVNYSNPNKECDNPKNSIVRIVGNYDVFRSNGFVYKIDEEFMYIISSSDVLNKKSKYSVYYKNGDSLEAKIIGIDDYNDVAILKTKKVKNVKAVCFANSNYLYKGQANYAYGYHSLNNEFYIKTHISQIGDLYSNRNLINIYKNVVEIEGSNILKGVGVFDDMNRLTGMISGFNSSFEGGSYVVESNKLLKIADSIVKTGKYNVNYIKYNLEDYSGLSSVVKESFDVSSKANSGVVITTFKPFNYLFGGLNQGMVIVAVNEVKIKNKYELDKQLTRYNKYDNVCLKVINKKGKIEYHHVKV